jgi:hypothetical protein
VVLYELLVGIPPFKGDSPEEIFQNILSRGTNVSLCHHPWLCFGVLLCCVETFDWLTDRRLSG